MHRTLGRVAIRSRASRWRRASTIRGAHEIEPLEVKKAGDTPPTAAEEPRGVAALWPTARRTAVQFVRQ